MVSLQKCTIMKDFLPILLGLLFFGVKYYNKTQKEKSKRNSAPNLQQKSKSEPLSTIDDFINQFYTGEKPQFATPSPVTIDDKNDSVKEWKEKMHEKEPSSIEFTDEHAINKRTDSQFETIQNKPPKNMERLDFDLKKAIVYDAIMNPPYI